MLGNKYSVLDCITGIIPLSLFTIISLPLILYLFSGGGQNFILVSGDVVDDQGTSIENAMIVLTSNKKTRVLNGYVSGDCSVYIMGFGDRDNMSNKFNIFREEYTSSTTYYLYVVADGYGVYKRTIEVNRRDDIDVGTIVLK